MLYYIKIDIGEGIDPTKIIRSKECMICPYFQDSLCNGCHDLTIVYLNISNVTIITVKNVDYCCIIHNISKCEAINLLKNYKNAYSRNQY